MARTTPSLEHLRASCCQSAGLLSWETCATQKPRAAPRRAPALPLESLGQSFCCGIGREAPSLDPSHLLSNALLWQDHEVLFFQKSIQVAVLW